jgi:phytoene/squalene synthetase
MNNCQSLLDAQRSQLPKSFDSLPAQFRVGLLSFQVVAKAMKRAFKEDQSTASVDRLFALLLQQQTTSDPLLQCAVQSLHTLPMDAAVIQGVQAQLTEQLQRKGFDTTAQFDAFVETVFGAFGSMVATLLSSAQQPLREVAKAIGVTRTLRELHSDVNHGFVMLPRDLLREYHVDLQALQTTKITEEFAQMINSLIEPLRRSYATFYASLDQLPQACQLAVYTFVKTQEAILDEIIWNRYDCLHTELVVSDFRQSILRFRAKRAMLKRGRR